MNKSVPSIFIARLVPRKLDEGNLRGAYIGTISDIRNYDIAGDYRKQYDDTVWSKKLPTEIALDFGQPPRVLEDTLSAAGKPTYTLKPQKGDILLLVHGSRNPAGDGANKRRGLIGFAQVEDIYFYQNKDLKQPISQTQITQDIWATSRCSLKAKILAITKNFLILPEEFRKSVYYQKSGLSELESQLGISSTSSSGNIGAFFGDTTSEEEKSNRIHSLISLFTQFDPTIKTQIKGTALESFIPSNTVSTGEQIIDSIDNIASRNIIFFGSPGSGKSRRIRKLTKGKSIFTTTFHPDYDNTDFVGAYKPIEDDKKAGQITYRFVPNIFIKTYVESWKNSLQNHYLVIEEINRGNCAQIFGDLFLLLDRDYKGNSDYILTIGPELELYLKKELSGTGYIDRIKLIFKEKQGMDCKYPFSILILPSNLYIYASMNTSDQSLFPMDSAFKRRWDWEYIPIDYNDAEQLVIEISEDFRYSWAHFIRKINENILSLSGSEDKQLGNRFVNPPAGQPIPLNVFKGKIIFYLWSEIYKHERENPETAFQFKIDSGEKKMFSFADLYEPDADLLILPSFMNLLGLESLPPAE